MAKLQVVIEGKVTGLKSALSEANSAVTAFANQMAAANNQGEKAFKKTEASFEEVGRKLDQTAGKAKEVGRQFSLIKSPSFSFGTGDSPTLLPRLSNDLKEVKKSFSSANGVAIEFNRIIQDAPFGIMGVGNNITQLASNFSLLKQQTGSTKEAFRQTISSMLTSGNLLSLGISAVVTGFTIWQMQSQKTKKETENLTDAINKQRAALEDYLLSLNSLSRSSAEASASYAKELTELNVLYGVIRSGTTTREQQTIAVEKLQKLYPDIFANMTKEAMLAYEGARAYDRLKNSIIQAGIAEAAKNLSAKAAEDYVKNTVAGLQATKDATKLFHEYNKAIAAKNLLERDAAKYVGQTISVNGVNFKIQKDNSLAITQLNTIINQLGREYSAANEKTKGFIKTSDDARKNMNEFNKVAIESAPALQKNNGLIGELQDKISKLESQRPFLKTKEDIAANTAEIKKFKKQLDDLGGVKPNIGKTTVVPKNFEDQVKAIAQKGQFSVQVSQASGLDELLLKNKQKYQGYLDELDKLEKANQGKNVANAKATQDAINKSRIDLVKNREAEAKQIELDYNQSTQDIITKILNDAGGSRLKSRQQELDESKNYFDELENKYRKNSEVLQSITEARKLAEAAINEKYDVKAYEGVKKMYDKIEKLENKPFAKNLKGDELKKAIADRLAAIEDIYKKIEESLKAMGVKDTSATMAGLKQSFDTVTGNAPKGDDNLDKKLSTVVERGFRSGISNIFDDIDDLGSNFYEVFSNTFNKLSGSVIKTFQNLIVTELADSFKGVFKSEEFQISKDIGPAISKGIVAGLGIAGGLVSGMSGKTSTGGQIAGGALSGAAMGATIGSAVPGIGTAIGAVGGAVIGGVAGFFSSKNAKNLERIQESQLAEQKKQTALLQYQNALSMYSNIIGQKTVDGIVTSVNRDAFGKLTAVVSGRELQLVISRDGGAR